MNNLVVSESFAKGNHSLYFTPTPRLAGNYTGVLWLVEIQKSEL